MDAQKEIVIYLAYSPNDLPYDRESLGNFIRQENDILRKNRSSFYLHLIECEDAPQIPENTALVISLSVCHGGGSDTLAQLWDAQNAPAVMTYFRTESSLYPPEDSYYHLKKWLEGKGHYWTEYPDVAVIVLKLMMFLQELTGNAISYTTEDGNICTDGHILLKASDFSFLKNNQDLRQLDDQIAAIDAELDPLRRANRFAEYKAKLDQRNALQKDRLWIIHRYYEYLEKATDVVSSRLRRARSAVVNGDLEQAQQILNLKEIRSHADNTIQARTITVAKATAAARQELLVRLEEYMERARILQMQPQSTDQILIVRQTLQEAADLEQREALGTKAQEALVEYILMWASPEEAAKYAETLAKQFRPDELSAAHARTQTLLAKAYMAGGTNVEKGYAAYECALKIWRTLYQQDPNAWFTSWAQCCSDCALAASSHSKQKNLAAAALLDEAWQESYRIYQEDSRRAQFMLVKLALALGARCMEIGSHNLAEEYYRTAEKIIQTAQEDGQHRKLLHNTMLYLQYGWLNHLQGDMPKSYRRLMQAMDFFRQLPLPIANQHQGLLVRCNAYLGYGLIGKDPEKATAYLNEALRLLNRKPDHSFEDLADDAKIHAAIGSVCASRNDMSQALNAWQTAEAQCTILARDYGDTSLMTQMLVFQFIGDGYLHARVHDPSKPYKEAAAHYFRRAIDLHKTLETPDYQAGHFTWTLFAKYIGVVDRQDTETCKDIYNRIKRFDTYKGQQIDLQGAIYYINWGLICFGAEQYREAAAAYQTGMRLYRPYVERLPVGRTGRYAEFAILHSRALLNTSSNIKPAVNVLVDAKQMIDKLPRTVEQLSAFCLLCQELLSVYSKAQDRKAWEQVAREYNEAYRLLKKFIKR